MTTIRQAEKTLLEAMLEELRQQQRSSTQMVEHLRGLALNHVLATELATFDQDGIITRTWLAPFAAVCVVNLGTGDVVVAAGGAQAGAPPRGTGLHLIPAGAWGVVNLASAALTLYGTAGEQVDFQAFTRPQPPAFGRVQ